MKYLILLNRKFPYKTGESFLENEIDIVSGFFDRVLIFPSDVYNKDTQTRIISSKNVKAIPFKTKNVKQSNLEYAIKGIFSSEKSKNTKSLYGKFYEGYFSAAAASQADKIWKALKEYNFSANDEIVIYSYWLFISAKVAIILKNRFAQKGISVKTISRAHRFDIYEENRKAETLPQRELLLSNLDNVYACSNDGANYLMRKYPNYKDKISCSYLATRDRGVAKWEYTSEFHIVSCSRVTPVKRLNLIVDVLKNLKNTGININFKWTHIGDGEELSTVSARAKKELNFMKTEFLGSVPNTAVYDFYINNKVDLFINLSESEGLPVSIMEAISFGIPVVATAAGGTAEIVINNISGSIVPVECSPIEVSQKILKIAQKNEQELSLLREKTRAFWYQNYRTDKNYVDFAKEII